MDPLELEFTVACDPEERPDRHRRGWAGVTDRDRRVAMSFGAQSD